MSKIDDLIQEFCPDGVEYKPIKNWQKLELEAVMAMKHRKMESIHFYTFTNREKKK